MDEAEESTNKCADSLDAFGNEVEGSKKGINALAAVLAELAASHQVIVITHLAQVAVLADHAVTGLHPAAGPPVDGEVGRPVGRRPADHRRVPVLQLGALFGKSNNAFGELHI